MERLDLSEAEWRERLTPEQYAVLRQAGTERAFAGNLNYNKASGRYDCVGCCARCDGHLGHVFPDGPPEDTGLRYCMNSVALDFKGAENG